MVSSAWGCLLSPERARRSRGFPPIQADGAGIERRRGAPEFGIREFVNVKSVWIA